MWEPYSFICELCAVDTESTSAVLIGDVASLHHEILDDSVEDVASVTEFRALLSSAETSEILSSLRHVFHEQFKDHSALLEPFLALFAYLNIEEGLRVGCIKLRQADFLLRNSLILI